MSNRKQTFVRWIPAFICMSLIFYLSHQPGDRLQTAVPWFQIIFPKMTSFNWGHFVAYFALALCIYAGLGSKWNHLRGKVLIVILCILYGVTDEFHQMFIPGRHPDLLDVRNDGIGAALAMIFISIPPVFRIYIKFLRAISIKY